MGKRRRKGNERKPRTSEVRVDFGRHQIISGMNVSDDGVLTFFDEHGNVAAPVRIEVGAAYDRPTRPDKPVLRQNPVRPASD
jgi:hypothetical protein